MNVGNNIEDITILLMPGAYINQVSKATTTPKSITQYHGSSNRNLATREETFLH